MSKHPKHIAIILDGNRRYGIKKGNKFLGHLEGAKNIEKLFKWCEELQIKELTLYTFSTENFSRPKEEVEYLMSLFRKQFKRLKDETKKKKNEKRNKINFIGRLYLFPEDIQKEMHDLMEKTKENKDLTIKFAVGYGGRAEIVDAVKQIFKKRDNIDEIDENLIAKNLYLQSKPDILIRPGGELRISNFLIWQCAYSELFFIEKLWPEFTKQDLEKIIEEFKKRNRRFGK